MLIPKYGSPDVFEFGEIDTPKPTSDQILVRVKSSSVNPVDCGIRAGLLKSFVQLKLPAVLGVDVSGEVVEAGRNVTKFKVGDNVYAFMGIKRNGGYGEYVAIPESFAARTPRNISVAEAGVVPGVGMTAVEAFTTHAALKTGGEVLINGAAGGVGTYAIQIAKLMGARVTAVCSTGKINLVRELGADAVIDYTREELHGANARYDVILNCVRGMSDVKLTKLLEPRGTLVSIVGNPLQLPLLKLRNLFASKKIAAFFVATLGENLQTLTEWIEQGTVKPVIEKTYSWKQLADAHRHCETGRVAGKIAITVNPDARVS
jgi:NADPH:quinone reductase-like Zn-dependent oxidoreductase